MITKLDLTNQSFGHLTAISPAEKIQGRTAWLCRCICGNECVVTTKALRSGKRTTCGCRIPGLESLHYVDGTCIEMIQRKSVRSNNKSGVTGVFYDKSKEKWRAEIMFQGKRKSLGRFSSFQDAVKARKIAEEESHNACITAFWEKKTSLEKNWIFRLNET